MGHVDLLHLLQLSMIHLNAAAIGEIQRMQLKHPQPPAFFRLSVQAGGCADLSYVLELTEALTPTDRVFNCEGIQVAVDAQSWPYLAGLSLDYAEDLMGGGFRFHNPNATSSCGCGNSFTVDPTMLPVSQLQEFEI